MIKGILNILYGFIGLCVSYDALLRLYQEGTFGNETHINFFVTIGTQIGFLKLASALCLSIGQVLDFLNKKSAIWFSRTSFILAITIFTEIYLVYERWYIWGYMSDFLVFSSVITIFYLPVIISKTWLCRLKQSNTRTSA